MGSIIRKILLATVVVLVAAVLYLLFWPVPIEPVAWQASAPPGYVGPHAQNTRLAGLRTIGIGSEIGPEHIAIGPDGKLYAAMKDGKVLRMNPDGGEQEAFVSTDGRVLGFAFDAQGRLIAADCIKGLLAVTPDAKVTVLTDHVSPDDPIAYANSVVVAPNGTIFFTDSSTRFAPGKWDGSFGASVLDILEQSATGRVLAYDPVAGTTRIVAHGFSFANGIALSTDGQTLFINETGRYRIWKIDAAANGLDIASGSPQAKILLDNLPGYPDNLMRGRDGRIWVGLVKPRNPAADSLAEKPFLRKILPRLPKSMIPLGPSYSHVFAIDEEGRVTEDLQDPSGAYPEATGATEVEGRLYIQSLDAHEIGWLPYENAAPEPTAAATSEEIYILRSIREQREPVDGWCASSRTGFEPFPKDAERFFSFWSLRLRPEDGRVVETKEQRVAELRGCFGGTKERPRQNFYAEVSLGSLAFQGSGECLALRTDFPEPGLFPVRCQLVLSGLPAPYVGGLLTTNTMTSQAALGADTNPPGYTQASIATIRLWRQPTLAL